ncbi:MAG: AraC family transcriptional regulator [Clostridia bacterium]|nr:AraC family transcriptional regulator [Clostridia bacterium]
MPKVNYYPPADRVFSMPVYVRGIGVGHQQEPVCRERGNMAIELHYTVAGCGVLEYEGRRQLLPAGTMFYSPLSVPHSFYAAPGGWTVDWVLVGLSEETLPLLPFGGEFLIFQPRAEVQTTERFDAMYRLMTSGSEQNRVRAAAKLYDLLCELAVDLERAVEKRGDGSRLLMQTAVDFVERSFGGQLTLAMICEACGGISEQYLCRLFRRHTGLRPTEYITRRRLEYARSLLAHTSLPVTEVAAQSGFDSASYFHRQWKRFEAMTPSEYRRTHTGLFT